MNFFYTSYIYSFGVCITLCAYAIGTCTNVLVHLNVFSTFIQLNLVQVVSCSVYSGSKWRKRRMKTKILSPKKSAENYCCPYWKTNLPLVLTMKSWKKWWRDAVVRTRQKSKKWSIKNFSPWYMRGKEVWVLKIVTVFRWKFFKPMMPVNSTVLSGFIKLKKGKQGGLYTDLCPYLHLLHWSRIYTLSYVWFLEILQYTIVQ